MTVTFLLRVPNLGYSDYIGDERKAFILLKRNQSLKQFFLSQRKGPVQFLVSEIPHFFTKTYRNEFAQRLPFTLFGIASVYVFYELVKRFTKDLFVSFIAALLLSVSGFIVGFARIAQYQSLNLFFSFAALYFYSFLVDTPAGYCPAGSPVDLQGLALKSVLGTVMFSLSLLSHWDALFVLIPVIYLIIKFLINENYEIKYKLILAGVNLFVGSIILLPFLIPYITNQLGNIANQEYFNRRIEFLYEAPNLYKKLIDLYNPFVVYWFYVLAGISSLFFVKKSWLYVTWFVVNFSFFELFFKKPGVHVYNLIIPLVVLCSVSLYEIARRLPRIMQCACFTGIFSLFVFFIYQDYVIFVNHDIEYPWEQESILGYTTSFHTRENRSPLFGFPHRRNWDEINDFINSQNNDYGYITNEDKAISEFYMDSKYKASDDFYIVGVKRPQSFVQDWRMEQYGGTAVVYSIQRQREIGPEDIVRIWKVNKDEK